MKYDEKTLLWGRKCMIKTIITSIITSIIVSLFTFIIGLRAGKNQADRSRHKDIYRNLTIHFEELIKCIEKGKPKNWGSYYDRNLGESFPIAKKMNKDGVLLEIPKFITDSCIDLEADNLKFGYNFWKIEDSYKTKVIEQVEKNCNNIFKKDYEICNIKDTNGKTYTEINMGQLFVPEKVKELLDYLKEKQFGLTIKFVDSQNKNFSVRMYSEGFNDKETLTSFLDKLIKMICSDDAVKVLLDERDILIKRNKELLRLLKERTNDPHPFWFTLINAFKDIFKNK
jgi:hypothetical protein